MVTWSTKSPRSARSSSTSRYDSEKRKYQPTASRIISGSNWRHLKRPETEGASKSIEPAYQITPPKLQHFPFSHDVMRGPETWDAESTNVDDELLEVPSRALTIASSISVPHGMANLRVLHRGVPVAGRILEGQIIPNLDGNVDLGNGSL